MEWERESILLYVIISNKMIVKTASNIDLPRGSVRDLHLFLPFNTATFYQRHLLLEHPPQGIMISQVIWLKNIVTHYSSADGPKSNSCQAEDRRTIPIFQDILECFISLKFPDDERTWCRHKMGLILLITDLWLFMINENPASLYRTVARHGYFLFLHWINRYENWDRFVVNMTILGIRTPGSPPLPDWTLLTAQFLMDSSAETFPEDQITRLETLKFQIVKETG